MCPSQYCIGLAVPNVSGSDGLSCRQKGTAAFWANAINQCGAAMHKLSHSPTLTNKSRLCPSWRIHVFRHSCRRAFGWYPSRCLGGFNISECAPAQQFCGSACSQMNPTEPPCATPNVNCVSCEPHVMQPSTAPQYVAVEFLLIFISKSSPVETYMEIIARNQAAATPAFALRIFVK